MDVTKTETATALVALVEANPTLVLIDDKKFEDFYEHVKAEAKALPVDLSTEKGRKAIKSMAHKIARTKTAIDEAGKKLNAEARAKIDAVDESRRKIRERFDALKDEVRAPLTEWEEAEEERLAKVERFFNRMDACSKVALDDTAESVKYRHESLSLITVELEVFHSRHTEAVQALDRTLSVLRDAYDRLTREEEERTELARLRAEKEERERQEAERKAAEERAEIERRVAEERKAREEAEAKRQEEERAKIAQEAEEKAKREAAEKLEAERKEMQAKLEDMQRRAREEEEARHNAEVARKQAEERAEREKQEAAEREKEHARLSEEFAKERERKAAEAERQRIEREKAEQERVEREQREADAKRQADREHRGKVMGAAKAAIIEIGIPEDLAKDIVLAIAAGNVPHVSIQF
ncbi:hypothetical protein SM0020_12410 [Sinorhizobium meliloti CCNWSX0020]|uniref:Uncharacterized protein n=1 Tax=Sinorhizobium meliloti CCNWSX0020 TaxID=1107881 RepID=H0FZ48_RHIML|nr:hypothetical protein [Sinorhizobium meliloti]EHK77728.1 hypothetical protein SM0020_12410 [Sinorhizobium meliloti CCNWSX0020]